MRFLLTQIIPIQNQTNKTFILYINIYRVSEQVVELLFGIKGKKIEFVQIISKRTINGFHNFFI